MLSETKSRFAGKKIILTTVLIITANAILAQTYNMKIKQGTGSTYSETSTVDEVTFLNTSTTPFVCGDAILYGGDVYPTVQIGSQCWFQRHLNIGTRIASSSDQTNNGTIEKYCYNDLDANCRTYGGLYQWAEAVQYENGASNTTSPNPAFSGNVQGICPAGWHIPTLTEFETLIANVSEDGDALKAVGEYDVGEVTEATNTSGFSALLAGCRQSDGSCVSAGIVAFIWSTAEYSATFANTMNLNYHGGYINTTNYNKGGYGLIVRCLKD